MRDASPACPIAIDAMTPIDAIGTTHERCADRSDVRIVSLVPSITELLCDLGLASSIVGRTGYCVHPADVVESIAKVGGTKTVNVAKIRKLAPTHLVVNIDENEKPTVDALANFVPHVIVTHPQEPRDNLDLYRLFGHVFAREREAEALCGRFDTAWSSLEQARAASSWPERRVLYLIWKDPWMTIARETYIASMLALIGWEQVDVSKPMSSLARKRECSDLEPTTLGSRVRGNRGRVAMNGGSQRYPAIDLARAARSADLVLLSSEPYRFTAEHVAEVAAACAIDDGRVVDVRLVDGELLSWYGSRAIAGLDYLGRLAHSDL